MWNIWGITRSPSRNCRTSCRCCCSQGERSCFRCCSPMSCTAPGVLSFAATPYGQNNYHVRVQVRGTQNQHSAMLQHISVRITSQDQWSDAEGGWRNQLLRNVEAGCVDTCAWCCRRVVFYLNEVEIIVPGANDYGTNTLMGVGCIRLVLFRMFYFVANSNTSLMPYNISYVPVVSEGRKCCYIRKLHEHLQTISCSESSEHFWSCS